MSTPPNQTARKHPVSHSDEVEHTNNSCSETSSDSESENMYEHSPRLKRQELAEDELPDRPTMGYGQGPWHGPTRARSANLASYKRSMYNLTISFARFLVEQGYDISEMTSEQRAIIRELLDADRRHKAAEEAAQAPEASAPSSAPSLRRLAEDVFPGEVPRGQKILHWGRGGTAETMKHRYVSLQWLRALYDDGCEVQELQGKNNSQLAAMWVQRRDQKISQGQGTGPMAEDYDMEPLEGSVAVPMVFEDSPDTTEAMFDHTKYTAESTTENLVSRPISMAAAYPAQGPEVSYGSGTTEVLADATVLHPTYHLGTNTSAGYYAALSTPYQPTDTDALLSPIAERFGELGITGSHLSPPKTTVGTTGESTKKRKAAPDGTGPTKAGPSKLTGVSKKTHQNTTEANRLKALAARVGRYPLALPGSNKGNPLKMQANLSASTIGQKFNRGQVVQLLKDYNVLPANLKDFDRKQLAQHLVDEREKLMKSGAQLQDEWDTPRLERYVADQEARGVIPSASSVPGPGSNNAEVSQLPLEKTWDNKPSVQGADSVPSRTDESTNPSKKRRREGSDFQEDEAEPLSRKRPRKISNFEENEQVASYQPQGSSAFGTPGYDTPSQSLQMADRTTAPAPLALNGYARFTGRFPQQQLSQDESEQEIWDHDLRALQEHNFMGTLNSSAHNGGLAYGQNLYGGQSQWSYTEQPPYEQQPVYQGLPIFHEDYNQDNPPPSQLPTSAYTTPAAPAIFNSTTSQADPDWYIDPALL